uniref:Phospholipid scramblase n=1 Tax=Phallusia mammillata TaxID=59560 RepID=A0A6F9DNE5_9ASCI|nr:phospholipid scramblase 1-like [Phallusia mammillata]
MEMQFQSKTVTTQPASIPSYEQAVGGSFGQDHLAAILGNLQEVHLHRRLYGNHHYEIKDKANKRLFYGTEGFQMAENTTYEHQVSFHIENGPVCFIVRRPLTWTRGCCCCAGEGGCCQINMSTSTADFTTLGKVSQLKTNCSRHYNVKDAYNTSKFVVKGPCCVVKGGGVSRDFPFDIVTHKTGAIKQNEETVVGQIIKCYSEFMLEATATGTNFTVKCKFYCLTSLIGIANSVVLDLLSS